jgi:hypothetical protein
MMRANEAQLGSRRFVDSLLAGLTRLAPVSHDSDIFQAITGQPLAANGVPSSPTAAATEWIDRHRRIWFVLVAIFLATSFNGQWHLGPDSAGYRQLAHNLAAHRQYFFRADIPGVDQYHNEQGTRYPGLPIVLAVLERLFGQSPLPPLILMMAMAVGSLVLLYRLMLYHLPRWLVVCVVVGVGINPRFIQYANEILSDMPFFLGLVVTLLGFDQVMAATDRKWLMIGVINTFVGLVLAAAMRPTFMILGVALVAACLWAIIRGRVGIGLPFAEVNPISPAAIRWRAVLLIGAFVIATILFIGIIDIRSRQGGFLSGGYEERMVSKLQNFEIKVKPLLSYNIGELLEDALPMAVMGVRSGWGLIPLGAVHLGFGAGFSLIVLIGAIGLARRNMLWGMFVLITVLALILAGAVPRYFLMILPFVLAGWAMFMEAIARRIRSIYIARFTLLFGLFFLLTTNAIASSTFILTQLGFSKPFDEHRRWAGLHHVGFLKAYDFGRWVDYDKLGLAIRRSTSPHQKIVGPNANVLTFLSDRQVYEPVLSNRTKAAGKEIDLAIFPTDEEWHQSKGEYERELKQFLRTLHKQAGPTIAGPDASLQLASLAPIPKHRLTLAQRLDHARRMAKHRLREAQLATRPTTQP